MAWPNCYKFKGILKILRKSLIKMAVPSGSSSCTWCPTIFLETFNLNLPYIYATVNSVSILSGAANNNTFGKGLFKKLLFKF